MRKRSFGRFSTARTMRLMVMVAESQREIESRKKAREIRKTANAPQRAAE